MNEQENVETMGEVRKNRETVFRVTCADYRERPYVHIELWQRLDGEVGPGSDMRRGMTIHPFALQKLIPLLQNALGVALARHEGGGAGHPARDIEAVSAAALVELESRERRR